jgi:hypothetical protein
MARGVLTAKTSDRVSANSQITFTAADGTNKHSFDNTAENLMLVIKNAHSGSHIVTIQRPLVVDGAALGNLAITVAAGQDAIVGPFPGSMYNQADSGNSLTQAVLVDPPVSPTALSFAVLKVGSAY